MSDELPTPRWIKIVQAIGSFALGIGTLTLAVFTFIKIPEIYEVVNKVKGLDETVVQVRESISISNEILRKVEIQIDFIASYLAEQNSKSGDKEKLISLLNEFSKSQSTKHTWALVGKREDDKNVEKIVNTWEKMESENKRKEYLYNVFKDYFNNGELTPDSKEKGKIID